MNHDDALATLATIERDLDAMKRKERDAAFDLFADGASEVLYCAGRGHAAHRCTSMAEWAAVTRWRARSRGVH